MRCDDTVCNCQSKACAALLISDKRGEDIGKMLFGNTAAGVLDFKENLTGGYVTGCKEMDSFVSGPVVNSVCGIAEKIQDYFFQFYGVTFYGRKIRCYVRGEFNIGVCKRRSVGDGDLL